MNKYQTFQFPNLKNAATYNCYICHGLIFQDDIVLCRYRNNPKNLTITHWSCSNNNLTTEFIQARDTHVLDIDVHQGFYRDRVVREVAAAVVPPPRRPERQEAEARPQAQDDDQENEENDADDEHEEAQRQFPMNYYRWFDENIAQAEGRDPFDSPLPPLRQHDHRGFPVAVGLNMQTIGEELRQQDIDIRNAFEAQGRPAQYNQQQHIDQRRQLQLFAARDVRLLTSLQELPSIDLRDELRRIMAPPEGEH